MKKDTHMVGVSNDLVPVLRDGHEMAKRMAHDNNSVKIFPMSSWKTKSKVYPKLGKVYEGIKIAKEKEVDFILCLGGGSVIDSAKAIALGALSEYDVWEYFEGKHEVERA